jgi:hypothetical protein
VGPALYGGKQQEEAGYLGQVAEGVRVKFPTSQGELKTGRFQRGGKQADRDGGQEQYLV